MDALNSVLDALEAKNDNIRMQMKEILESNKQEREQEALQKSAQSS